MKYFIFLLLFLLNGLMLVGQNIPPRPSPARTVNDLANVLRPEEAQRLEFKLRAYNDSTSTQIVVVTLQSVGEYAMQEVALKILRDWGVGQRDKNNGVVVLAAIQDRKVRIETGYGLEGTLPDVICKRIVDQYIIPAFKTGNYYQGFNTATDAIVEYSKGEYTADPNAGDASIFPLIVMLLIFLVFLYIIYHANKGKDGTIVSRRGYSTWDDGGRGWWIGGGGYHDGSTHRRSNDDDWGGGGGFDFGGGSGGGGGADGSW